MVKNVRQQGQAQIHGRGGSQCLDDEGGHHHREIVRGDEADGAADDRHHRAAENRLGLAAQDAGQGQGDHHADGGGDGAHDGQDALQLSAVGHGVVSVGVGEHGGAVVVLAHVLDHAAELVQEEEHHHDDPVLVLQADGGLPAHGQGGLALRLAHGLLRHPLPGEEVLDDHADEGDQDQGENKHLPGVVGGLGVIDRGPRLVHVVQDLSRLVQHRGPRSAHVIHEQQVQKEGQDHAGKTDGRQHGGVGDRRQQAPVLAVPGAQADQRRVGRVVHGIGKGKPKIVPDGDADQGRGMPVRSHRVEGRENEQEQQRQQADRHAQQQQGPGLSGPALVMIHQPAHQHVAQHHKDHGNHRQGGEEAAGPAVDVQHVGHVFVEIIGENRIRQQRQRRAQQIAQRPLREQGHVVLPDQTGRQLVKKCRQPSLLFAHSGHPPISLVRTMECMNYIITFTLITTDIHDFFS